MMEISLLLIALLSGICTITPPLISGCWPSKRNPVPNMDDISLKLPWISRSLLPSQGTACLSNILLIKYPKHFVSRKSHLIYTYVRNHFQTNQKPRGFFKKMQILCFLMGLFSPTHAFSEGFWQISLKRSLYVKKWRKGTAFFSIWSLDRTSPNSLGPPWTLWDPQILSAEYFFVFFLGVFTRSLPRRSSLQVNNLLVCLSVITSRFRI